MYKNQNYYSSNVRILSDNVDLPDYEWKKIKRRKKQCMKKSQKLKG